MKITIEKPSLPNENQISLINKLFEKCNRKDTTCYTFDLNDEFNNEGDVNIFLLYEDKQLVSAVTLFVPGKKEAEVIACTLPDFRKKGYFQILFHEMEAELKRRKVSSVLLVCDHNSSEGRAVAEKMGAVHEYSEFLLKYKNVLAPTPEINPEIRLKKAEDGDKARLIEINSEAFDSSIEESAGILEEFLKSDRRQLFSIFKKDILTGMIGIYLESDRAYIHGFCIHKSFRGQGTGRQVLAETVQICREKYPEKSVELEVHAQNESALGLYKSTGFQILAEFRYYRLY